MAKVLVTGLRAPGSLEWIRALSQVHEVHGMDFMKSPVGKFSKGLESYTCLSSPITRQFNVELIDYLEKNKFDLIIPTCEEIFHIYKITDNNLNHKILAGSQLYNLHSKLEFNKMGFAGWLGKMPNTRLKTNVEIANTTVEDLKSHVYKPEFTRFGSEVFVCPDNSNFIKSFNHNMWLEQDFIKGEEICTYILAHNGIVFDYSFYIPKHRSGKAGIYFQWVKDERLLETIKQFVKYHNLHGQISFDVIKKGMDYYFLECNPRMTSGIHNISHESLIKYIDLVVYNKNYEPSKQIEKNMNPSMLLLLNIGNKGFFKAKDIIYDSNDMKPTVGQVLSTMEVLYRSYKNNLSLVDSTVYDISYPIDSSKD